MGKLMQSKTYYFKTNKIIRDLIHGYINVTDFELKIMDTAAFQRLKDVRQLTCQHVYPAARHTRFEHSLGVLELTRYAIKYLNQNGMIMSEGKDKIIDENLAFNAYIAALLHDVGHCPFSHLGEVEFDKVLVREELLKEIEENKSIKDSELSEDIIKDEKKIGTHELISCIVILRNYQELLGNLTVEARDKEDACSISTDYELIIRAILGIEYDVSTKAKFEGNGRKNIIVRLINSDVFDMDKLDYIMRDSMMTGIGTPAIDTKRLFKNIYLDKNYSLVFASRAVSVLQNMIDSKDGLYLYVYNHHAVIFSDFMNSYILRKLSHNARDFLRIIHPQASKEQMEALEDDLLISSLGLVPKPYLFSTGAIIEGARSDSDWISLLNIINTRYLDERETIRKVLISALKDENEQGSPLDEEKIEKLADKIQETYRLIHNYKTRKFLKPWWKTVFEFTNFMNQHFQDDEIRKKLGKWICNGGKFGLESAEIRSQIAKHVRYIVQYLYKNVQNCGLVEPLEEGDFFIIQRSNRFFELKAIEQLQIALKVSEIIGAPKDVNYSDSKYYIKNLTNIIPQKDYSSIYAKEGFYVFSKQVQENIDNSKKQKHYKVIEEIFAFVAAEFVNRGEQEFISYFNDFSNLEEQEKLQQESLCRMLESYRKENGI